VDFRRTNISIDVRYYLMNLETQINHCITTILLLSINFELVVQHILFVPLISSLTFYIIIIHFN
jgi:hypothetical protein